MGSPSISVVMSVYNGQAFLSEAIESILGQTLGDFDFLIIDDGWTDATAKILSTYASQDRRVNVFRHENKGRAESLNVGIRRYSVGKILCKAEFTDPQVLSAAESRVPGWNDFHLHTQPDGRVYQLDSLFMEATRP